MKIEENIRARVETLIERGAAYAKARPQWDDPRGREMLYTKEGWIASALHILETIFPSPLNSHRARASVAAVGGHAVGQITGILVAALEDIDAGVIASVADSARSELFDDFLDHAGHYLKAKPPRVGPAGVVAGVAFEDTVRRGCTRMKIPEKGVELEQLIITLTKADKLTELQAKRGRVAAGVRTKATHAQWDEFTGKDVEAAIATTRDYIDTLLTR